MKCIPVILSIFMSFGLIAQQIDYAEFYFDADPGFGNGTSITLTPDDTLDLNITLPVDTLDFGFHLLYLRVHDTSGIWSILFKQLFFVDSSVISPDNGITSAEYFFDADPGFNSGHSLSFTEGDTVTQSLVIPIDTLTSGFHNIYFRSQDSTGTRSMIMKQLFYIDPITSPFDNGIVFAEFFIDTDPGFGSGYPIPVTPGDTATHGWAIPVDTLDYGLHSVFFRALDSTGMQSILVRQYFFVEAIKVSVDNGLVALEYYIDVDPGPGQGTQISVTPGDTIVKDISIPVDALTHGFHTVYFRSLDSTGSWSVLHKELILVKQTPTPTALPDIVKLEYHYPNMEVYQDPEVIAVSGDSMIDNTLALLTVPLESGQQTALIRAMNDEGIWSPLFRTDTFLVLECEFVTNTNDSGMGSFRYALDCTNEADTVWFDPAVHNQTIFMKLPRIDLDKELYVRADTLSNITIANEDATNSVVLLSSTKNIDIEGLNFVGQSPGSLIFSIKSPEGGIVINGVLWENILIKLE